jgi:hypothetical protein
MSTDRFTVGFGGSDRIQFPYTDPHQLLQYLNLLTFGRDLGQTPPIAPALAIHLI